jgi:ankyrin repeat protein
MVDVRSARLQPDVDRRVVDAAKAGNRLAVISLIQQKADVNVPEPDGTTAISWAVRQGDFEIADRLIKGGANVKAANRYGVTPPYLASLNGDADVILKLIKAGAGANDAVTEGETALMTGARSGHLQAVKVLLEAGATVDARENWRGQTALMWAAETSGGDQGTGCDGADVNATSNLQKWERQVTAEPREKWLPPGGLTPMASRRARASPSASGCWRRSGPNFADQDGVTPLINRAHERPLTTPPALLDAGADPNKADNVGRTPSTRPST